MAGIDFSSGAPVAITSSQMIAFEGCATISDIAGNLLFYTNESRVWNRNHHRMPNGYGLKGDAYSSTQSSLIVPKPSTPNVYYIFTIDASYHTPGDPPDGLNYSVVDMNADNNGNGDIVQKNRPLCSNAFEKLAAVAHSNLHDIWIVCRQFGEAKYSSYLVTATGVSTTPVVSNSLVFIAINEYAKGYMKFSPQGDLLMDAGDSDQNELSYFDKSHRAG